MTIENLSTLYTLSFTKPRLDPSRDGDFCAYFVLESRGSETFVTDLAVFIHTLGQELMKWSVLGDPSRVDPCDPAHPVLRDIAYCWDGVACGYGVLQFSAIPVSVTNIRRNFHQTSRIFEPLCHRHRHEYFSSGIFSDWEDALLPLAFAEIEAAAQYVPEQSLHISIAHSSASGNYVTRAIFSLSPANVPDVSRIELRRLFCAPNRNPHVSFTCIVPTRSQNCK